MKKELKKKIAFIFPILIFTTISFVFAQDVSGTLNTVSDSATGNKYLNVFSQQTFFSLTLLIFKFVINYFAAPALVLALVYSGFLFVKAQGNEAKLKDAKKFATGVLIGIVVAAASSLIISVLIKTINDTVSQAGVDNTQKVEQGTGD